MRAVASGKFLDAPGGIDEFLFAGKEGMAGGADTNADVALGGAGMINGSAGTGDRRFDVVGMKISFHKKRDRKNITDKVSRKR